MSSINRLKSANESVGAAAKEIRSYLDANAPEKRDSSKLEQLEKSYDAAKASFDAELRQAEREGASSKFTGLSDSEKRDVSRFDYAKTCRSVVKSRELDGIEAEITAEGAEEARAAGVSFDGVMLPSWFVRRCDIRTGRHLGDREQRLVTATGGTSLNQGGFTIPTEKQGVLDAFYNALVLREAGATILTGCTANFDWPRYTAPTAATAASSENANGTSLAPTFTGPSFSPKRLSGYVDMSDQLLAQSPVLQAVIERNIVEQHVAKAEYYAIHGAGSGGEPRGILATTGIGSVIGGTNGALPSWANIVKLENKVAVQNAARGTCHYLTNYKVKGTMEQTLKTSADTASTMIYDADKNGGRLKGWAPLFSNNVSSALTKGSASAICSAIIFGQYIDSVMAFWGGLNVDVVRDKTLAIAGERTLVFNQFFDHNVVRPVSFAAQLDVLTTPVN